MQKVLLLPPALAELNTVKQYSKKRNYRKLFRALITTKILLLLAVTFLQASAGSYGQTLTLSLKNVPLQRVFDDIQKQSRYLFIYTNEEIDHTSPVSIDVKNMALDKVLALCLERQSLEYTFEDPYIIIKKRREIKPDTELPRSNTIITGKVLNEKGEAIEGATVAIKGSTIATACNDKGEFVLEFTGNYTTLVISSIGYANQEIPINGQSKISITLRAVINNLDETVIMAYGNTTRRLNTGNISRISAEEIGKQPVSNPLAALEGRAAGVFIQTQNSLPGGAIKVQIRGQGSIAAGNDPLYIVDGVPFISNSLNAINNNFVNVNGLTSPLNIISPSEIESVEILKDADATAIYGSRAANGVIMITTKRGKTGKSKVDFNIYQGFSSISRATKFLNLNQYLAIRRKAFENDQVAITATNAPDLTIWDTTKSTNWEKYLFGGQDKVTQADVSLSGGNLNTHFLFTTSYRKEGSILPGDQSYNKANIYLNLEHNTENKRFYSLVSINYTEDNNRTIRNPSALGISILPPDYPIYNSDGTLNWYFPTNPFAWMMQKSKHQTDNIIGNSTLKYLIIPSLSFKASLGYNKITSEFFSKFPAGSQRPGNKGVANFGSNGTRTYIIEPQIEYEKSGSSGNFDVLLGATYQKSITEGYAIEGTDYVTDALLDNLGAAGTITNKTNNYTEYKYASAFSRIKYDWRKEFLVNLSFRRDGSSKFGPGKKYGNFGALGLGWIFSKSGFIEKNLSFLSFGKIRMSYGITGNDRISDYGYLALLGSTNPYQGLSTLQPTRIANADYEWESNKKFELGLNLGFARDRILADLSYYINRSGNQLVPYPIPSISGPFASYQANLPALVLNKGLEIELNTVNLARKELTWKTAFNISFPKNKLKKYPGLGSSSYANTYVIGEDLQVAKRFLYTGIDPATGIAQFKDINGDGVITSPNDYVVIGKTSPDYFGGFSNNVNYKAFDFDLFFQFVAQHGFTNPNLMFTPGNFQTYYTSTLNYWRKPGEVTTIQKPTATFGLPAYDAATTIRNSSAAFINSSYIRLKNVSISYSLPSNFIRRIKIQRLKVYLEGQNLLIISPATDFDPETISGQDSAVPALKTIVLGIQLSF